MDIKKTVPPTPSTTTLAAAKRKGIVEFAGDIKKEIKLVSWTTKDELSVYTKIVIGATFVFGMLIYVMDLLIQGTLHGISFITKWLGG